MLNIGFPISLTSTTILSGLPRVPKIRHNFYQDNSIPAGFTLSSGSETYNAGGLVLDGTQSLNMTLDGSQDWFTPAVSGYMIARFIPAEVKTVDQYIVTIHDGGSFRPSIAMRYYRDDGRYRSANYAELPDQQMTETTNMFGLVDAPATIAQSWDGTNLNIYDDNSTDTGAIEFSGSTFTDLTLGDDHNGGQGLNGTLVFFEIGAGYLTYKEALRKMMIDGDKVVEVFGQSQITQLFNSLDNGPLGTQPAIGHAAMIKAASQHLPSPNMFFFINSGDTGSSLCKTSNASDAWVDNTVDPFVADIRLTESQADADARGQIPALGLILQYQGDVFDIAAGNTTIEDYEAALDFIADTKIAAYGPNYKIILVPNGGRNEAVTDEVDAAHQQLRELYKNKPLNDSRFLAGPEIYDLGTYDATGHLTWAENQIAGERYGNTFAEHLGLIDDNTPVFGPTMTSITNHDTETFINITHEQGTTLNNPANFEGFAVFDEDGTRLAVSAAVRNTSTQIKLTHASPAGATIDVKYPYGALEGVNLDNVVKDNSSLALPLQSFAEEDIAVGESLTPPREESLDTVESSTVFDLDATLSASYPGTGQVWANIVASPADGAAQEDYDFYRGLTDGSDTTDPTFTGTANDEAAYWANDGGDYHVLASGTNTTFLENLHKADSTQDWWAAFVYRATAEASASIMTFMKTRSSATGMQLYVDSDPSPDAKMIQRIGSTTKVMDSGANFVTQDDWNVVIFSYDTSADTLHFWINSNAALTTDSVAFAAGTDPAGIPARLFQATDADVRFVHASMGNKLLTDAEAEAIITQLELRHNRTYTA